VLTYRPTNADRAELPVSYLREPRYLGYREIEGTRPFAKYFAGTTRPVQAHVRHALLAGMAPPEYGYDVDDAVRRLAGPGYHNMETGFTRLDSGVIVVSCLTDMPGVTAAMWDWWFGWHIVDTARYKLWYPDAHQFCTVGEDRSADRCLTDRQRYLDNVSYVDEYIGGALHRLAIRFIDPDRLGFDERPGTIYVCALVGWSTLPIATSWLIHQIRPTDKGSEMRSRFFIGHTEILDLPAHVVPTRLGRALAAAPATARAAARLAIPHVGSRLVSASLGHELLFHCASEMNHLASLLPGLYEEFHDTP